MSRIEGDLDTLPTVPPLPMNPPPSTLPRGGRNPFKNMGSKLVDRVRRSLSRSNREKSEETEAMQSSTMSASRIGAEKPPAKVRSVGRLINNREESVCCLHATWGCLSMRLSHDAAKWTIHSHEPAQAYEAHIMSFLKASLKGDKCLNLGPCYSFGL